MVPEVALTMEPGTSHFHRPDSEGISASRVLPVHAGGAGQRGNRVTLSAIQETGMASVTELGQSGGSCCFARLAMACPASAELA